jgi:hypothetical protein
MMSGMAASLSACKMASKLAGFLAVILASCQAFRLSCWLDGLQAGMKDRRQESRHV